MWTLWRWSAGYTAEGDFDAMKRISTRFALLMAAAAVVPLLAYGAVSILSVRDGAQRAVKKATRTSRGAWATNRAYVIDNVRILKAVAAQLERPAWRRGNRVKSSRTSSGLSRVPTTDAIDHRGSRWCPAGLSIPTVRFPVRTA